MTNNIDKKLYTGGYIFSSGHNIQANMPSDNIVRLFELANKYGRYPIHFDACDARIEQEEKLFDGVLKKTDFKKSS